jgi:hypothetical protein
MSASDRSEFADPTSGETSRHKSAPPRVRMLGDDERFLQQMAPNQIDICRRGGGRTEHPPKCRVHFELFLRLRKSP